MHTMPKKATPRIQVKRILEPGTSLKDRFIPDLRELRTVVDDLKRMGYRIVLTQGVYDLLHEGHALYLEKALSYGDILIVGVDSDELTRKRKGPGRPIVPQTERIKMLAHLRHVGIITLREAKHPLGKLIEVVRPDVLITSASTQDFPPKDVEGYKKFCGKVVTLPPQATTSTTARIRILTIDGADRLAGEMIKAIPDLVHGALERFKTGKL